MAPPIKLSAESKHIIETLRKEIQDMKTEFITQLNQKCEEVNMLKTELASKSSLMDELNTEVKTLKKDVTQLRNLIDDSDAYERKDTIIISGSSLPTYIRGEDSSSIVREIIREKLRVVVNENDVSTAHRLGRPPTAQNPDKRGIIVKLCRRDVKNNILEASRKMKLNGFFASESLTPTRLSILKTLKDIKKKHGDIVKGCTSYDGKIYAYTESPNPAQSTRDLRHLVNTKEQLMSFCTIFVKKPMDDFLAHWPRN